MYQLVMLNKKLDHTQPYLPNRTINGEGPQGRTYGAGIEKSPYSNKLIELILSCLYEKPKNRPLIQDLKTQVFKGVETSNRLQDPESWETLQAPEPIAPVAPILNAIAVQGIQNIAQNQLQAVVPAVPVVPARPVRTFVQRCSRILANGRQCSNEKRLPGGTANPRCFMHADLNRYPI